MNKTTEALKLAEEALYNTGNALMCLTTTRNLRPMYQEMRDDATEGCNKALAAIREAKAELEKQEPVAHYKDAPHTIYLQTGCDDPEDCECSFNEWGGTTWCADQIHDTDIPYIRADYAAPVSAKMQGDCTLAEPKCSNLHKAPY